MNHEPECPVVTFWLPVLAECRCDILRPAYQRGREDAAESVRIAAYKLLMSATGKGISWEQMGDVAIAAARGNGDAS